MKSVQQQVYKIRIYLAYSKAQKSSHTFSTHSRKKTYNKTEILHSNSFKNAEFMLLKQ